MKRQSTLAALGIVCATMVSTAHADTQELSVRPRVTALRSPSPFDGGEALSAGAGFGLGLGVTPSLTVSLVYDQDRTSGLEAPGEAPGVTAFSRLRRHKAALGLAFAPFDELTPTLELDVVLTQALESDRQRRIETDLGTRRLPPDLPDRSKLAPGARLSAGIEWRFLDFYGVAASPFVEYGPALAYGLTVSLVAFKYL